MVGEILNLSLIRAEMFCSARGSSLCGEAIEKCGDRTLVDPELVSISEETARPCQLLGPGSSGAGGALMDQPCLTTSWREPECLDGLT